MRPVLLAFVDTFSRPLAIAGLAAAQLATWLAVQHAVAAHSSVGIAGAIALVAVTATLGRAWRAMALATALPRVVAGAWPAPERAVVRAARLLALDVLEGALLSCLGIAALLAIDSVVKGGSGPLVMALALAPFLMLSLLGFATFRQAALEVAVAGAPAHLALGQSLLLVLSRPRALLALQAWWSLGVLPLGLAALGSGSALPMALVAAAAALWGYAALGRLRWSAA